jgi:hypothetical protein
VPEHSKPIRLAHAALLAGVDGKWQKATDIIARINAECPREGLADALVAWCDAIQEHSTDGDMAFQKIRTVPMAVETGELNNPAADTPQMGWAQRLIVARAAGDRDAFVALLDELNAIGDGWERGRYVSALVTSAALTIRTLPRGYATLGRS